MSSRRFSKGEDESSLISFCEHVFCCNLIFSRIFWHYWFLCSLSHFLMGPLSSPISVSRGPLFTRPYNTFLFYLPAQVPLIDRTEILHASFLFVVLVLFVLKNSGLFLFDKFFNQSSTSAILGRRSSLKNIPDSGAGKAESFF